MKKMSSLPSWKQIVALILLSASAAFAQPAYDTFGQPDIITAGHVDQNVAVSTASIGGGTLTLGMSAQQRFGNDLVTDNGAGTFFAQPGQNAGDAAHPTTTGVSPYKFLGSTWNFDFYIDNTGNAQLTYVLSYGLSGGTVYTFDPTTDADAHDIDPLNLNNFQDSQNLLFSTFGGAANAFAALYDPNANATYDFLLTARSVTGGTVAQAGITVQVGTGSRVPDAGSTLTLLGLGFAGIAGLRRKFAA